MQSIVQEQNILLFFHLSYFVLKLSIVKGVGKKKRNCHESGRVKGLGENVSPIFQTSGRQLSKSFRKQRQCYDLQL